MINTDPRVRWLLPFAVVLVTAIAYWPVVHFPYLLYDDPHCVTDNAGVRAGTTWASIQWGFTTGYFGNWHPLTWMSLQLDWMTGNGSPHPFHRTNLCLHLATIGVLSIVYRRLGGSIVVATIATLLYALHPMHVESVAWVSERKGILSTFFLSLTLLAYLRFSLHPSRTNGCLVVLPYALSLMSKQMGVTVPFLFPLIHLVYGDSKAILRSPRSYAPLYAILLVTAAAFSAIAYATQAGIGALSANESRTIGSRLATAIVNYARYLRVYVWPDEISFDYHYRSNPPTIMEVVLVLVAGLVLFGFAWRVRKRTWRLMFVISWYVVAFLPVIGLIQIGLHSMAMRYADWPLVMVHLGVAWLIVGTYDRLPAFWSTKVAYASLIGLASLLMILTRKELSYWSSDETLYSRAIQIDADNPRAHSLLGLHHFRAGNRSLASKHYLRSDAIDPRNGVVLGNLALLRFHEGDIEAAITYADRAIQVDPGNLPAKSTKAMILVEQESYAEAAKLLEEILEKEPSDFEAIVNRAAVSRRHGNYLEAIQYYERALRIEPNRPEPWLYLAVSLRELGRWPDAASAYAQAITVSGGQVSDAVEGLMRLKLLRGEHVGLEPFFGRLDQERTVAGPWPESAMLASLISGEEDPGLIDSYLSKEKDKLAAVPSGQDFDLAFRIESLADCFDAIGDDTAANEAWKVADRVWPMECREIVANCREARKRIRRDR